MIVNKHTKKELAIIDHLELMWTRFEAAYPKLARYRSGLYFAGGCIRSLVQDEQPKDYDLFFQDSSIRKAFMLTCEQEGLGKQTLNSFSFKVNDQDFQVITIECETPHDEVMSFDFTCNMNYYDLKTKELFIYDARAAEDKELIINFNCRNPFDTFYRVFDFMARGYSAPSQTGKDMLAVRMSQIDPIHTKGQFVDSTRRCTSAAIIYGRLDFLEDDE